MGNQSGFDVEWMVRVGMQAKVDVNRLLIDGKFLFISPSSDTGGYCLKRGNSYLIIFLGGYYCRVIRKGGR